MEQKNHVNLPKYYELLNNDDKNTYKHLRNLLSAPSCKNRKNKSYQTFCEIMDLLKAFIIRNDPNADWRRGVACGIYWIENPIFSHANKKVSTIAINIRQLTLMTSKCKSSINGLLQQMGYIMPVQGTEASSTLITVFPFLKNNFQELRQWTIRQKIDNDSIAYKDQNYKNEASLAALAPILPSHKIAHLSKVATMIKPSQGYEKQALNSIQNGSINAQEELISPAPNLFNNDSSMTISDQIQSNIFFSNNVDTKVNNYNDSEFDAIEKVGILDDPMTFGSNLINDSELFSDSFSFNFGSF